MLLVSFLCVLVLGCLLVLAAWTADRTGASVVSAIGIIVGSILAYQFLPAVLLIALNDGKYVWLPSFGGAEAIAVTAMVCVVGVIFFLAGYVAPKFRARRAPLPAAPQTENSRLAAWILVVIGVAMKVYAYYAVGGGEASVLRLSVGVRESLGIEALSPTLIFLKNLSGIADAGATWLLLEAMRTKRHVLRSSLVFALVVGVTYFGAGKRLFLLWPVVALLLGYHHYIRRIRLSDLPLVGLLMLAMGFGSLLFRIYAPAAMADVDIDLNQVSWAQGSMLKFYFFSLEFASFEVLTLAIEESRQVVGLFGTSLDAFYATNIQPLSYFVPRVIWPDKPEMLLDLSHAYRVLVLGGRLDSAGGVAATLLGTSWTLAGPIGLAAAMFCLGVLSKKLDMRFRVFAHQPDILGVCWYAFWLVVVFHLFRQGTIAWTVIISVMQQVGLILGFAAIAFVGGIARSNGRSRGSNAS